MITWMRKLDDKLADMADAFADFIWVWTGTNRVRLTRVAVVLFTTMACAINIPKHDWNSMFIDGAISILCFLWADRPNNEGDVLSFFGRMLCVSGCAMAIIMHLIAAFTNWFSFAHEHGEAQHLWFVFYTLYWYLIYVRNGKGEKKERRFLLEELKKMFGSEWIPEPVAAEE